MSTAIRLSNWKLFVVASFVILVITIYLAIENGLFSRSVTDLPPYIWLLSALLFFVSFLGATLKAASAADPPGVLSIAGDLLGGGLWLWLAFMGPLGTGKNGWILNNVIALLAGIGFVAYAAAQTSERLRRASSFS